MSEGGPIQLFLPIHSLAFCCPGIGAPHIHRQRNSPRSMHGSRVLAEPREVPKNSIIAAKLGCEPVPQGLCSHLGPVCVSRGPSDSEASCGSHAGHHMRSQGGQLVIFCCPVRESGSYDSWWRRESAPRDSKEGTLSSCVLWDRALNDLEVSGCDASKRWCAPKTWKTWFSSWMIT